MKNAINDFLQDGKKVEENDLKANILDKRK